MKRRSASKDRLVIVTVLLAATALGAWGGARLADGEWPFQRRPELGDAAAARGPLEGARSEPGGALDARLPAPQRSAGASERLRGALDLLAAGAARSGQAAPGGAGEPRTDEEREEARQLTDGMKRLVRDLEFNAGFPEPPQQTIVRPPDPWMPDPGAERNPPPVIERLEPRAAPASGGALVKIRGRNLRVSQVMFGHAAARIVGGSAEAVSVVAPPARAGPVVVAVTNDDGTYALAPDAFTYRK